MRRKKTLWERLFKRPRYIKISDDPKTCLHVQHIDKETNILTDALGMTPERQAEIQKMVELAFTHHNDIVAVCEDVSKSLKHANELFFATFIMTQKMIRMNDVGGVIARIMNSGKPD